MANIKEKERDNEYSLGVLLGIRLHGLLKLRKQCTLQSVLCIADYHL